MKINYYYLFYKISAFFCTLLLIFCFSRALIFFLPGNPIETLIAETGTKIPAEQLKKELKMDRPFLQGTIEDLYLMTHGNWGKSIINKRPIAPLLKQRIFKTSQLALFTLMLGIVFSLIIGLLAAGNKTFLLSKLADTFCTYFGALSAALPTPWIGPILLYCLGVAFPIFPLENNIFLPAITLSIGFIGLWSRLIRSRVKETIRFGSAVGARARGISEPKIFFNHGFMPASGALLAYLGTQIGGLLTGSFVVEIIFNWQGLGMLFIDSVFARDYPIIQACVFTSALFSLLGNYLGDFLKFAVDPRGESD